MRRTLTYAAAILSIVAGCVPVAPPDRVPSESPAAISPAAVGSPAASSPAATPTATPCVSPVPETQPPGFFKPQPEINGRTVDPHPYFEGLISVKIAVCAAPIDELIARYGLKGPARQVFTPPFNESARRVGLDRHFQVGVEIGTEHREVERLAAHPEDFEVVTLAVEAWGGAPEGYIPRPEPPDPAAGPPGTSFTMRVCCWKARTAVMKTFIAPDGTTHVVSDVVRDDNTVPARWGGSSTDARGLYFVTTRGGGVASRMRFAIGGPCWLPSKYIGDSDNAIFGHAPDRIEVSFCMGRRPDAAEVEAFTTSHGSNLISTAERAGSTVYTFGIGSGRRPMDLVRELLRDDRVRFAAVIPVIPGP